jgi:predicted DNA-binding transcriptional regulator AlpA
MENKDQKGAFLMLLTVTEVAQLLRKSRNGIYDDFARGLFPIGVVLRVGGRLLFNEKELEKWIARGGTLAQPEAEKNEAQDQNQCLATTV